MTTDTLVKSQPSSQRVIPPPDAQVDLAHSSILDLCTKTIANLAMPATAVFIRPPNVGIEDLLRGGNSKVSYTFNGLSVQELQSLTAKALKPYPCFYNQQYPGPAFGSFYPIGNKADIYAAIEQMHSRHRG